MFNAHIPYVVEMYDLVLFAKVTAHFALCCRFDVLVGREMVHDHRHLFLIVHAVGADVVELTDRHRRGNIVAKHAVEIHQDQLTRLDRIQPRVCREDLLCHCH